MKKSLLFALLFFFSVFFLDMIYTNTFEWEHVLRDLVIAALSAVLFYLMTRKRKRKDKV